MAESPYIVRVAGGQPTARTTTVTGPGCRTAVAGQGGCWFVVEPRDAWGNRVDPRVNQLGDGDGCGLELQVRSCAVELLIKYMERHVAPWVHASGDGCRVGVRRAVCIAYEKKAAQHSKERSDFTPYAA